jgi:hypothetical protein
MVSAKSTGGGTPVSIYLDTGIGASISARANCTAANKRIRFNPTRINTNGSPTPAIWARWVAAHEMGHIFRMGHTGGLEDTQEGQRTPAGDGHLQHQSTNSANR